jgi:hydroxymethylpyrimidine kinase/phosphomethylpyrimidine kinase/thiamine-phosphate diphosphorylase
MTASSGESLLDGDAGKYLREQLLPRTDLITPNRNEAEALLNRKINSPDEIERAATDLVQLGARSALITGGHFEADQSCCHDYWTDGVDGFWLSGPRIPTIHTHGGGCTLASATAAAVAIGYSLKDALVLAKMYVTSGLRHSRQMGGGPGPILHAGWPESLANFPGLSAHYPQQRESESFASCGGELGLYPVMPSAEWIEKLLPLGVSTIQLRVKNKSHEEIEQEIVRAVSASRQLNVRLFINDYWQLAIKHGAYGVHLGQEDLDSADIDAIRRAGLRLGISNHSYYELARAHTLRPSYLALGPIFPTTTKVMKFADQGIFQLSRWCNLLKPDYTLCAIGGINRDRAPTVLATGVGSVAVVSAITEAADVGEVVSTLQAMHVDVCK